MRKIVDDIVMMPLADEEWARITLVNALATPRDIWTNPNTIEWETPSDIRPPIPVWKEADKRMQTLYGTDTRSASAARTDNDMVFDVEDVDPRFKDNFWGMASDLWDTMLMDAISETTGARIDMATGIHRVRYVAIAKHRRGGWSCAGLLGTPGVAATKNDWRLIVPVPTLIEWFGTGAAEPVATQGYYSLLMIDQGATRGAVKKAFYRLAKQWHPDVCKEPNADAHFARLGEAYDVLSDPGMRQKYDAIRAWKSRSLETTSYGTTKPKPFEVDMDSYVPPLRCGDIEMSYHMSGKWMIADKILKWDDITDQFGSTLVSSWNHSGLQEEWA